MKKIFRSSSELRPEKLSKLRGAIFAGILGSLVFLQCIRDKIHCTFERSHDVVPIAQPMPQTEPQSQTAPHGRRVGILATWNLRMLNDELGRGGGVWGRGENEYGIIADSIRSLSGVARNDIIVCMQEIENHEAISLLGLNEFDSFIIDTSAFNPAFVWGGAVETSSDELPVDLRLHEENFIRPPLTCFARMGDFDFLLVNIHLKARGGREDNERNEQEVITLLRWLVRYEIARNAIGSQLDPDVVVMGDWNRSPDFARSYLAVLLAENNCDADSFIVEAPITPTVLSGDTFDFCVRSKDTNEEWNVPLYRTVAAQRPLSDHDLLVAEIIVNSDTRDGR